MAEAVIRLVDHNKTTLAFTEWMHMVDVTVERLAGCSVHDLPDLCFADLFEDGVSSTLAAHRAIRNARD